MSRFLVNGPSLYRHECRKCAEETLHNARGCVHCGTSPWRKPVKLDRTLRKQLTHGMKWAN